MRWTKLSFLVASICLVSACNYSETKTPTGTVNGTVQDPTAALTDKAWVVSNFFSPNCSTCHNSSLKRGGYALATTQDIESVIATGGLVSGSLSSGAVTASIQNGRMPPSYASRKPTETELNIFRCWVQGGLKGDGNACMTQFGVVGSNVVVKEPAPKDPVVVVPPPPTEEIISFEYLSKNVLTDNCVGCHAADYAESGVAVDSWAAIVNPMEGPELVECKKPENSKLLEVIESGEMPLGAAKLSPELIEIVRKWIEQDCPK